MSDISGLSIMVQNEEGESFQHYVILYVLVV